jgi:hypothetical protein
MKKLFLFAALFAAVTMSAKELTIDLSQGESTGGAVLSLNDGELTASYDLGEWEAGGVSFALDNKEVTNIAFEYIGDATVEAWVSFIVYLVDSEGGMWYSSAADLSISSWVNEWSSQSYMPSDVLWKSSTAEAPVKPFTALVFVANPEVATAATFAIRNVKITVPDETAIDNTVVEGKAVKVIRDGQVMILRDGKAFNALGVEMK